MYFYPKCPQICDFAAQDLALSPIGEASSEHVSKGAATSSLDGRFQAAVLQLPRASSFSWCSTLITGHTWERHSGGVGSHLRWKLSHKSWLQSMLNLLQEVLIKPDCLGAGEVKTAGTCLIFLGRQARPLRRKVLEFSNNLPITSRAELNSLQVTFYQLFH